MLSLGGFDVKLFIAFSIDNATSSKEQGINIMILHTIGHSNISVDAFVKLLYDAGIEVLVDVRSSPYSKYASQFNKEELMNFLTQKGIRYLYMGDSLGGRPLDKSCYIGENPDYDAIRQKDFYKIGLDRLIKGIAMYHVAIMCSEEDAMKCHRRNLIGIDIHKRGIQVIHIRGNGIMEEDDFLNNEIMAIQTALF